jgi:hypothetical protein
MNLPSIRRVLYTLTIVIVVSCEEPEKGLLPGLPANVKAIELWKSARTNSQTIVANGVNSIQFEIKYLDEKRWPVWGIDEPFVQIRVNDQWELKSPYQFRTTQPGTYNFSLRTNDGQVLSQYHGYVKAIQPVQHAAYRLPVIFHYLDSAKTPKSTDEKDLIVKFFTDSLAVVNNAFGNRRGSKDPNAVDAKIEFYLATEDPDGQPLEYPGFEFAHAPGMTSEWESLFFHAGDHYWPPSQYVNVWIVTLDGWNGFAFYPSYEQTKSGYPGDHYGTFVERTTRYIGITLAHELAHMLDVWHVFGFDCDYTDFCEDTPAYIRDPDNVTAGEKVMRTSCDSRPFAATNIMDYPLTENTTFTHDQILRMHYALANSPFLPTERNQANGRRAARSPGLLFSGREKLVID